MPDTPKPSDLANLKNSAGPAGDPPADEHPENPPADNDEPNEDNDEEDPEGADALGDKGKKALDSMKAKYRAEKQSRRDLENRLQVLEAQQRNADLSDQEKAIADAKAEATQEAIAKANKRIARSEVKSVASSKVSDLDLALQLVDLEQIDVDDDGNVDEDQISEVLDELVKKHPILAAQRNGGGFDSARGKQRPSNPSLAEKIAQAQAEGNHSLARTLKATQLGS